MNLAVVELEFTLVGMNPALDEFKDVAAQLRDQADRNAEQAGRQLSVDVARTA